MTRGRAGKSAALSVTGGTPRVALVLGSGAAKGFAHVGVLKVLEAEGIPVHRIVGTSVGSLVGVLSAYGHDARALRKIALSVEPGDLADPGVPDGGFLKGEKLEEFVDRHVRNTPIERLRIPFHAVATDLQTGRETLFGEGSAGRAVRASCAIPGVFRPVRIGDRVYVDGGVVSPVPVGAARRLGADRVIAVDVTGTAEEERPVPDGTLETVVQAFQLMYARIAAAQLSGADVVIRPEVGGWGSADFGRREEAIREGERAASGAMPRIRAALARSGRGRKGSPAGNPPR